MFIGQTFIEDQSQNTYSEDSLDNGSVKSRQHENNNHLKSNTRAGSIILAGHLAGEHSISLPDYENVCKNIRSLSKDINISDETSYLSVKPDLNKCINLSQDECPSKENSEVQSSNHPTENKDNRNMDIPRSNKNKTVEVQCNLSKDYSRSISLDALRNVNCPCNEIRRSKSCTTITDNLNGDTNAVKTDQSLPNKETATDINQEKIHIIISPRKTLLISRCSTSLNKTEPHSIKEDKKCDSTSSERSSKELNPSELRALLNSLDQKSWREEGTMQKNLLRRMSVNFYDSPKNFTEQLLTIIEESFINNDTCEPLEYPDISLCRLTEELRKMCKFIEDETAPEWPRSPNATSNKRRSSKECQESKLDSSKSHGVTPNLYTTTLTCNIKSPKKIYRHMTKINAQSPKLHDSTSTFESLEAFCKTLYPNEYRTPPGKKDKLQSPIRDMKYILLTCKNQMASLDNSPNIREQLRKAGICNVDCVHKSDTVPETQDLGDKSSSNGKCNQVDSKRISHVLNCKQQIESSKSSNCKMIDADDLESTLMYELAKKRQRCLETAKVISEIDASSESASSKAVETQQSCSSNVNIESNINDSKFMETLMTVKRYQNYLEEYKPLLNVLQQTESSTSQSSDNEKDTRLKKTNKAHLEASKSPMMRKKVTSSVAKHCSPNNNAIASKPRLFVTPGKTVTRTCNSKRTYFPNLITATNKQKGRDISPHEKKVYRQMGNYDHVISPVGMYIKSTNPSLVKNLRPKTDEMLLTPKKKQAVLSASPKPKMKFRLSPKEKRKVRERRRCK